MDNQKVTPYEQARRYIQPYDAIICYDTNLLWRAIGHTATFRVVKDANGNNVQISVFESTQRNVWSGRSGVQCNPLSTWKHNRKGAIEVLQFFSMCPPEQLERARVLDDTFFNEVYGLPYPKLTLKEDGWKKLVYSAIDLSLFGKDVFVYKGKDKGIFCTQLYVARIGFIGLLQDNLTNDLEAALYFAQEFEPDDVKRYGKFWQYVQYGKAGASYRLQ